MIAFDESDLQRLIEGLSVSFDVRAGRGLSLAVPFGLRELALRVIRNYQPEKRAAFVPPSRQKRAIH